MANFAPYQDTSPSDTRALSPPPRSLSRSPIQQNSKPPQIRSSIDERLPSPSHFGSQNTNQRGLGSNLSGRAAAELEGGRSHINLFETSLPMRLDYEAMMAYLLLPPAGGVLLLVVEHKSDFVRFHAWQSSLLFTATFILHLIVSPVKVLSWMLLVVDLVLIAFLALKAYQDADTLDRFEVPFFGALASRFVDSE